MNDELKPLEKFVQGIQSRLATIDVDAFFAALKSAEEHYQPFSFSSVISHGIFNYEPLIAELVAALGRDQVAVLFDTAAGPSELVMVLFSLLQDLTEVLPDATVRIDEQALLAYLNQVAEAVQQGEMDYTISLHFTNIDIDVEFEITKGIRFRRLEPLEVLQRYPVDSTFHGISDFVKGNWANHCVEAVIERRGPASEVAMFHNFEYTERFVNSLRHPFIIAAGPVSQITHLRLDSLIHSESMYLGIGVRFNVHPTKLSASDIKRLQRSYGLLRDAANDRVLETAIDRFIIGRRQSEHQPHHVNEANWDKLVDYVIAMESLFLTAKGDPLNQELSYRFAINGSSVLSECVEHDRRAIFKALRSLYELRSKIVHGSAPTKMHKPAGKFIEQLGLVSSEPGHVRGQFRLIAKTAEEWITAAMFHLNEIPTAKRPYNVVGGWEDLLFDGPGHKEPTSD